MCLCEWFSGGKDIVNELQVAAEGKQTNSSSSSYYIITNWSLGCSQTDQSHVSLKNACWRGRTVGSGGRGCDQVVTGEGNRQRRGEAAAKEMKTESSCRWSSWVNSLTRPEWAITWSVVDLESTFLSKAIDNAKWTQTDTLLSSKDSTSTLMTPKRQFKGLKRDRRAVHYDNHHNRGDKTFFHR